MESNPVSLVEESGDCCFDWLADVIEGTFHAIAVMHEGKRVPFFRCIVSVLGVKKGGAAARIKVVSSADFEAL